MPIKRDLSNFRLLDRNCSNVGLIKIQHRLRQPWFRQSLIIVSLNTRSLEIFTAMSRSPLAKQVKTLWIKPGSPDFDNRPGLDPTALLRFSEALLAFPYWELIRIKFNLRPLFAYQNHSGSPPDTVEVAISSTGEKGLLWLRVLGLISEGISSFMQSAKLRPRIKLVYDAFDDLPLCVITPWESTLAQTLEFELELEVSADEPFSLDKIQTVDSPSVHEIMKRLPLIERLSICQRGWTDGNLDRWYCWMPHEALRQIPGATEPFLPALRELTLSDLVLNAVQLDLVFRCINPHLRKLSTSHVAFCDGVCDGKACGKWINCPDWLMGGLASHSFLQHLTALDELNLEVCKEWFEAMDDSRITDLDGYIRSEHTSPCECSGRGMHHSRECWDIGGYYLNVVAKQT